MYFIHKTASHSFSRFSTTFKTIYRNIYHKKFEPEIYILNKFISAGSLCFDIGAAYGRYTFIMSRLVSDSGHIYSFEPGSYSCKVLSNVVKFHQLENVTIIKKSLSEEDGFTKLTIPIKKGGKIGPSLAYLSLGANPKNIGITEEVELTTIDKYCSQMQISRLDFIKCDVEGVELSVFRGGEETIRHYQPVVLCEVDKDCMEKFGFHPREIYDFFRNLGYNSFVLEGKEIKGVNEINCPRNYFFIHSSGKNL